MFLKSYSMGFPIHRLFPLAFSAAFFCCASCVTNFSPTPTIQAPSKNETFRGPVTQVSSTTVTIIDKASKEPRTFKISPKTTVFGSAHNAYATIKDLAVSQYISIDTYQDRLRIFILRWQH